MGEGKDVGKPLPDLNVAQGERENAKRSELADEDTKRKKGANTQRLLPSFLLFFILTVSTGSTYGAKGARCSKGFSF